MVISLSTPVGSSRYLAHVISFATDKILLQYLIVFAERRGRECSLVKAIKVQTQRPQSRTIQRGHNAIYSCPLLASCVEEGLTPCVDLCNPHT